VPLNSARSAISSAHSLSTKNTIKTHNRQLRGTASFKSRYRKWLGPTLVFTSVFSPSPLPINANDFGTAIGQKTLCSRFVNTTALDRFLASEPPTSRYVTLQQIALVNKFAVPTN
jgi:hypothetical protein